MPVRIEDRIALEDLNSAFCHLLDHNKVPDLIKLFSKDVIYISGSNRVEGHEQLRQYLEARTANGPRTSRHIYSGLQIAFSSDDKATGHSVCLSFAQNGTPPLPPEPFMVADFEDVYVRDPTGQWLIAERSIRPVFRR